MEKRYICGRLGKGPYPSQLTSTRVPPRRETMHNGSPGIAFYAKETDIAERRASIDRQRFAIVGGRVREFTGPSGRMIGREIDSQHMIVQIDAARLRVETARAELQQALRDEQGLLELAACQAKPAKVPK